MTPSYRSTKVLYLTPKPDMSQLSVLLELITLIVFHEPKLRIVSLRTFLHLIITSLFYFFGAAAAIWALSYLHETPRLTSVF
jgi:hypothetical protein